MKNIIIAMLCFVFFFSCKKDGTNIKVVKLESKIEQAGPSKVTISETKGKYQLMVDDIPFYIKGAGLEFGDVSALAKHHGNSFRTWRTENGQKSGKAVLDEAHKYGLKVAMGIEVGRERHGFDYNNEAEVHTQFERIRKEVMALKDHPALLLWGIGNELNLRYTNTKVWDAVNAISKMIHEVDGNHITTTSLAGISKKEVALIKEKCTDLDVLSIQMYGDLERLPKLLKECDWTGPYIVTEWGATGHWEVPKTNWGAPIEEHSTQKAANYLKRYKAGIEIDSLKCLGSYVFLWGQKQERTPTWYGVFIEDGSETESVDVMHYIWNNKWPDNKTPQIKAFTLNNKTAYDNIELNADEDQVALINIIDVENDQIDYSWEVLKESTDLKDGGDKETRPNAVQIDINYNKNGKFKFKSPKKGHYRLFVYANDGHNHSATANIPFSVK